MTLVKATAVILGLSIAGLAVPAEAGCLKGAIVGGLAGKLVGHGYAGAAAGCAYGVHKSRQNADRSTDVQTGRSAATGSRY